MGLHNRDYARDSHGGGGGGYRGSYGGFTSDSGGVVKKIIIATIAVFVLQLVLQVPARDVDGNQAFERGASGLQPAFTDAVSEWCSVRYTPTVRRGQIWRLLTYAFCHNRGDIFHIAFNLYILWWAGREVESLYGSKEFLWFYLVAAFFAGACYVLFGLALQNVSGRQMGQMIGASGAVSACIMLFGLHYPRRKIHLMGVVAIEARYLIGFKVIMDVYPILLEILSGRAVAGDNIAHTCHLGGFLFGWIYFKRQFRLSSLVNGVGLGQFKSKVKARKSDLKIFSPPAETKSRPKEVSREQLDAILEKISQEGEESLTDAERAFLTEASEQYKAGKRSTP